MKRNAKPLVVEIGFNEDGIACVFPRRGATDREIEAIKLWLAKLPRKK